MKPRTLLQKKVAEQSKRLAPITQKQQDWAFQNCFDQPDIRGKADTF